MQKWKTRHHAIWKKYFIALFVHKYKKRSTMMREKHSMIAKRYMISTYEEVMELLRET